MNISIKFLLTLFSTLLLFACSNGSGGKNDTYEKHLSQPEQKDPEKQNHQSTQKIEFVKPDENKTNNDEKISEKPDNLYITNLTNKGDSLQDQSGVNRAVIKLENSELIFDLLPNTFSQTNRIENTVIPKVTVLHDNEGNLVGYTGYAQYNILSKANNESQERSTLIKLYFQDADKLQHKLPETLSELIYKGKMNYYQPDVFDNLTADVIGVYSGVNKTFEMNVYSDDSTNIQWKLVDKLATGRNTKIPVQPDNSSISGILMQTDLTKDRISPLKDGNHATFNGGLYGKNGEVLVGKVESLEDAYDKKWQGVIDAKAQE